MKIVTLLALILGNILLAEALVMMFVNPYISAYLFILLLILVLLYGLFGVLNKL